MKTSVKRRAKNCIRGAVLLACFIAVWYVASCFTQPLFIPAPATVWEAIVGLAETGQLQKGLAYSFLRITGASALSMLVAIPLSLLIYGVKPIKETIMPVVSFLRYVPVTAFSPLLILWFGIGEQMKISFLFIATFVYLLPSILLCFNDVPQDLMDTGKTTGKFQEAGLDVVMPVFTNYSAGGDGIIAKSGINTVNDLLGKKIGVPRFSEAQTLVAWFVNKSDLSDADKQSIIDNMILFDDASETGEAFFAGQLDVAATWQPYLSYATENGDAHIMFSTTASKSLIMDGIVFRSDFAQAHPDVVTAFIDGIFQANAMYTTEFDYIRSVMPMFAGVSDEEIKAQCGDAEMMGYAENKEVLDSTAPSVYFDMCDIWESLGETVNRKVAMTLFDNQYLLPLASKYSSTSTSTSKPVELTEEQKQEIVNYEALLTKSMTVEFVADTAQFKNPEEAYAIMDEFVSIANTLDGAIIQVEGNINARNYSDSGQALSAERAKAVAKYFIACGIDPNRLITVGNGNTKMVADPGSADAYLNRRTDVFFKIIEE